MRHSRVKSEKSFEMYMPTSGSITSSTSSVSSQLAHIGRRSFHSEKKKTYCRDDSILGNARAEMNSAGRGGGTWPLVVDE